MGDPFGRYIITTRKLPDAMHFEKVPTLYSNQKLNLWSSGFMTPYILVGGNKV